MRLKVVVICLGMFVFFGVSSGVLAYTTGEFGSGTYGSCDYGTACSITLSSNGSISIDVTPTTGGQCTIQSDVASVQTDDSNGYTLMLADSSTDTSLLNGASSIPAGSGTLASPAALTPNSWGWRVDGLGSFGSGHTTAVSNVSPNSTLFAAIKASNVGSDTVSSTSAAANPAEDTTVWYGACADSSVTSGSYTTGVTYTAVAN